LAKITPTKTIVTTFNLAKLFFDMWVKYHEMPQFMMNNRDTQFMTGFWKHLFRKVGMKLSFNTTFHPQFDGQTKGVDEVLNQYFKNYVNINQKDWDKHLGLMKFCYNSTTHLVTKMSPFELALGKEARKLMDLIVPME
jgi:hypothetical protein